MPRFTQHLKLFGQKELNITPKTISDLNKDELDFTREILENIMREANYRKMSLKKCEEARKDVRLNVYGLCDTGHRNHEKVNAYMELIGWNIGMIYEEMYFIDSDESMSSDSYPKRTFLRRDLYK